MRVLAIDPGSTHSAFVVYDDVHRHIHAHGKVENFALVRRLASINIAHLDLYGAPVIEMVGHYGSGMSAGAEVFDTCIWIGMYIRELQTLRGAMPTLLLRQTVKAHLCRSTKANDANIRQAVIDRFGGDSIALAGKRCGRCKNGVTKTVVPKKCPHCDNGWTIPKGPLYDIAGDEWAALAVALTFADGVRSASLHQRWGDV